MTTILLRRGTTADWVAENTVLEDGELGVEDPPTGPSKFKIGDGVTHWNDLPYAGNSAVDFPVRTVQGDKGDVRLSLYTIDGVQLDVRQVDEQGNVIEPGPVPGEFLGFGPDGIARNLPINLQTLGADDRYAPKDPHAKYLVHGYAIPRGGSRPTDLPDVSWIADENNPELNLVEDVYIVSPTTATVTLPPYLDYSVYKLKLGVASTAIQMPAAPTVGSVTIEVVIDQDDTTGSRVVTWSSNVRWDKVGGSSAAPTLETATKARNRFRFKGTDGQWECISRLAYAGNGAAGPAPVYQGEMHNTTGLSNTQTGVNVTYPAGLANGDVCVMSVGVAGNSVLPNFAAIAALGFVQMDGPITNNDTTPSLRAYLFKKKLNGTESGTTVNIPWDSTTGGGTERGVVQAGFWRGADYDRVNDVPSRDTTADTTMELISVTPSVDNSVVASFLHFRYNTGVSGVTPGVTMSDSSWFERVDQYEGRATDGTIAQFGSHLASKPLTGGAAVATAATSETLTIGATFAGFMAIIPPTSG